MKLTQAPQWIDLRKARRQPTWGSMRAPVNFLQAGLSALRYDIVQKRYILNFNTGSLPPQVLLMLFSFR